MNIRELVNFYVGKGMTINQAENFACQQIVLNKIAKSPMVDQVLIKGGVLMFNMTHSLRRVTTDIDFDFIKYSIPDESIKLFIDMLNKYDSEFKIKIIKQQPLHQEDYDGKRVLTLISDNTYKIRFKLDIGVHTLFDIEQSSACFSFSNEKDFVLKVNPCEQIFAEKLYSLAKHDVLSTRYKDIFDMYYLISNSLLNDEIVKKCLLNLLENNNRGLKQIANIYKVIESVFSDNEYIKKIKTTKDKWIDEEYETIFSTILSYLNTLNKF